MDLRNYDNVYLYIFICVQLYIKIIKHAVIKNVSQLESYK